MSQLGEAIGRYHKLLETDPQKTADWAAQLRETMTAHQLALNGKPVSPVLRPHFLSRRQYTNLVKMSESLLTAIDRVRQIALTRPDLQSRLGLLPAEKMLAALDPGYSTSTISSLLDTMVNNGSMHLMQCRAELPNGLVFSEMLADVYYDAPMVKEFRKKHKLAKMGGTKPLVQALLKTYKEYGGKKKPNVAILDFRQPFQSLDSLEYALLAEILRKQGLASQVVSPEQLEYRNGILRSGEFVIDLIYRGVKAQEFLLRYDLNHPLVRAYREQSVCIVNSFRSELARKKAIFDLLTDSSIVGSFPAAERKAIAEAIPWTRMVSARKTTYKNDEVDLLDFIQKNRETLILRPNDETAEQQTYDGAALEEEAWERALKIATRNPYVVQERVEPRPLPFPVDFYGDVVMRDLNVDVQPHNFLGKVQGCSAFISPSKSGAFSSLTGIAPAFILEVK